MLTQKQHQEWKNDLIELQKLQSENLRFKDALDWIKDATGIKEGVKEKGRCKCGRVTGVLALYYHAKQALKEE